MDRISTVHAAPRKPQVSLNEVKSLEGIWGIFFTAPGSLPVAWFRMALVVVIAGLGWVSVGGSAPRSGRIPLHVDLSVSSGYDDNIFLFSRFEINRIEAGTVPYRIPYSTWDDWISRFGITLALPWEHANGWETRLEGSAAANFYAINHVKNYQSYAVSLRQTFGERWWIQTSFSIIPSYYLREFFDRDLRIRAGCDYENRTFEAKLRYRSPWQSYLYPFYQFKTYYYNRYFTEFDAESNTIGLAVDQLITRRWKASGSYRFTKSDNVGGGGPTASPTEDTEYGDANFGEDEFRLGGAFTPRRLLGKPWEFSASVRLRIRNYTTDNSVQNDPFHAGREDTRWEVEPKVSVDVLRNLTLWASFQYEQRHTDSSVDIVREFKDFVRRTYFVGLEYQLLPLPKSKHRR